jgi:hypothetical protein
MSEITVTEINITDNEIEIIRMPERKNNEFLITGVSQKYPLSKDVKINITDKFPVRNLEEELRICELGNKQLREEIKRFVKERIKLIDTLRGIKAQYENDFTEEELQEFFEKEPREECIYNATTEVLREIDI